MRRPQPREGKSSQSGRAGAHLRRVFRSLRVRNYRLYFFGQLVSVSGIWMDHTAKAWLVLDLTGSGLAVGIAAGLGYAPLLLMGPWAGVVADRLDKRRLLAVAYSVMGCVALAMSALVASGLIQLWMVYSLALLSGLGAAFENPARRSFLGELVERRDVENAVSLYSSIGASSRAVGPAIAGLIIAAAGVAPAYLFNGVSYLATIFALLAMRPDELRQPVPLEAARGQLREGLRYALTEPHVRIPLVLMAVVGTLAFNYPVTVPLMATQVFDAGPTLFGALMSVLSAGSLIGSLYIAGRRQTSLRYLAGGTTVLGLVMLAVAAAPGIRTFMALLVLTGATSTAFTVMSNGILQRETEPLMIGRVMALFSVAFIGSTTIGSPIVGLISQLFNPRVGLGLGGLAAVVMGVWAFTARPVRPTSPLDE